MTKLTDSTQEFWRALFQQQGPDTNCIIDGKALGWSSCTMYAGAMALDSTTGGAHRPSGCQLRKRSGDTVGGTTLRQLADSIMSMYGIFVETFTGSNVLAPSRVARYVRAGRKVVVQGGSGAMVGTPQQSTAGDVNHAVAVLDVRGGTLDEPKEGLVYDPAADGRKRAYHVDQGPTWWPWSLIKKFLSWLRPNGAGSPRLGTGKAYTAVFPDSEPHVRLHPGARKTHSFPDFTRADKPSVGVYAAPTGDSKYLYGVKKDTALYGYQWVNGKSAWGSTLWMGNDDGTEWVPVGAIRFFGGT